MYYNINLNTISVEEFENILYENNIEFDTTMDPFKFVTEEIIYEASNMNEIDDEYKEFIDNNFEEIREKLQPELKSLFRESNDTWESIYDNIGNLIKEKKIMSKKYFVQINSELNFAEVLKKLNIAQDNELEFSNLSSSVEWLLSEDIVNEYIERTVKSEGKDLFISHKDGLSARVYTSDIVDYDVAEKAIKEYDFNEVNEDEL